MFGKRNIPVTDGDPDRDPRDQPEQRPAGDPDETAALIDALTLERDAATRERDEFSDKWKRALAEYQNYQRRAIQNEVEAKRQGAITVLHSIVPVLDHFDMALGQPIDAAAQPFVEGIKVIRAELMKALELHGVTVIAPQPGDTFEPGKHEAIMQQPAEGIESGHISRTFQVGYSMDNRVIRSAKVAVTP